GQQWFKVASLGQSWQDCANPVRTSGSARESPRVTAVCRSGAREAHLQALSRKPSDGLEPSTPSLPWRSRGGHHVTAPTVSVTFVLKNSGSRCVGSAGP